MGREKMYVVLRMEYKTKIMIKRKKISVKKKAPSTSQNVLVLLNTV